MIKTKGRPDSAAGLIIAVSGGADSVYLLERTVERLKRSGNASRAVLVAHVDHRARGRESDEDARFVEMMAGAKGLRVRVKRAPKEGGGAQSVGPAFEERARNLRYAFLKKLKAGSGAGKVLLAHTADDQVETVLMRVFEGAGIAGLKGIPRETAHGIERPMLDTWREEILSYLKMHKIPFRVDKSNFDTRFERNWVRHVLIPMLEKRYGKSMKKRIFALGERFREIDEFLETAARRWMKRNVKVAASDPSIGGELHFPRKPFGKLPAALRKKILQIVCFDRIGIAPNERLLESMDRLILNGGPSARLNVGKGAVLMCRYDRAIVETGGKKTRKHGFTSLEMRGPGIYRIGESGRGGIAGWTGGPMEIRWEEKRGIKRSGLKVLSEDEETAAFDLSGILLPLSVRPLRAGDRIKPFGMDVDKKVKEIMIDRKVPRDERWGRPVVCDAEGRILWIPGVVRSAHAPVTADTRLTMVLRLEFRDITGNNQNITNQRQENRHLEPVL